MKLNPKSKTGLPKQMTDDWVVDVLNRMLDSGNDELIDLAKKLRKASSDGKLKKQIVGMCKNCLDPIGSGKRFNQIIHGALD